MTDFTKQAEELAEALQGALISEGSSEAQAARKATKCTARLCQAAARSERVKTVIAAATFTSPQDVLTRYAVATDDEGMEKQILMTKIHATRSPNGQFYRNRPNNDRNYGNYTPRRNNFRPQYSNSRPQYNNFRPQYNNFRPQYNNRGTGNQNRIDRNNNRQPPQRFVRVMQSENSQSPQTALGDQETREI